MKASQTPRRIAIIGGGFSGTMTAVQLSLKAKSPVQVFLVEKSGEFAAGAAYGTRDKDHLLNVRTDGMGAFPEDPGHFLAWLQKNRSVWSSRFPDFSPDAAAFAPRALYAVYLRSILDEALNNKKSFAQISCLNEDVVDLEDRGSYRIVAFGSGKSIEVDAVVLAMGNMRPSQSAFARASELGDRYIDNIWTDHKWTEMDMRSDIAVVGSGLTMADAVITLSKRGFKGKITVLSRRGLLPQPHEQAAPLRLSGLPKDRSPRSLLRWLRLEIDRAGRSGGSWRSVIDALRPMTQSLWAGWSVRQRGQFLRHLRSLWDTHRHRMPGQVAENLEELRVSGRLYQLAARVVDVKKKGGKVELVYRKRGSAASSSIVCDYVINCSGPESDFRRLDTPFVRSLLKRGMCSEDALGLGFRTGDFGAVLGRDGRPVPFLFAIGPLRKGSLWESTAVPEIREQSEVLARRLLLARGLKNARGTIGSRAAAGMIAVMLSLNSARAQSVPAASQELKRLEDRYWELITSHNPDVAFSLGAAPAQEAMQDISPGALDQYRKDIDRFLNDLEPVEAMARSLAPMERTDLKLLRMMAVSRRHSISPEAYQTNIPAYIENPVAYLEYRQTYFAGRKGTPEEWGKIAGILEALPAFYRQAREYVQAGIDAKAPPFKSLIQKVGIETAREAADYFEKQIPARAADELGQDHPAAVHIKESGAAAAAAIREFSGFLENDVLPRAKDDFAMGEREAGWRLKNVLGLDMTVDQAMAMLDKRSKEIDAGYNDVRKKLLKKLKVAPEKLYGTVAVLPKNDKEVMRLYEDAARRAQRFIKHKNLIPLHHEVRVEWAPVTTSYRDHYVPPPVFRDDVEGAFFISRGRPAEHPIPEIAPRTVHEALPGHDAQFQIFRGFRDSIPRFRWLDVSLADDNLDLADAAIEGWAMYATAVMRENNFFSDSEKYVDYVAQKGAIFYAKTELAIQSGKISLAGWIKKTGMTEKAALDYLYRMYEAPLESVTYALGEMAIEELKRDYKRQEGGSDAQFHEAVLSQGPVPLSILREVLVPSGREK